MSYLFKTADINMIRSKAIDLIKTFNEEEFRQFGLYTESPYFNRELIQVKFYELLKKYYPEFKARTFTKEQVYSKLYPGKTFNDGIMRNILSKTLELAENFLAIKQFRDDEFNHSLHMLQAIAKKGNDKLFGKVEVKAAGLLEKSQVKDEMYFLNLYLLNNEKRLFSKNQKSSLYFPDELLKSSTESISLSFLIFMLRNYTDIANTNLKMFRFEEHASLTEFEKYADSEVKKYKDTEYLQYYYYSFKLAKSQDEKYFFELKKIADLSHPKFSERDRRDIFTILTNFCYFKVNSGDLNFRREHFQLLRENFERGTYKGIRNFVDHINYLNVTVTGLDAGEIKWVEEFILKYKPELDDSNRENSFNFANALVYYKKGDYDEALNKAAKVKTDDLSYKHQLKSLYMKIYFEMNVIEPFYSHVDSYRHFLLNEKHIPENTRNSINNYVNFTKKLFDIKIRSSAKDFEIHKVRKELLESKAIVNKLWLLDKVTEIENSLPG